MEKLIYKIVLLCAVATLAVVMGLGIVFAAMIVRAILF